MDTLEDGRIKLSFQILHSDPHDMGFIVGMDAHVIARRINPVDVPGQYERGFRTILDRDPVGIGF